MAFKEALRGGLTFASDNLRRFDRRYHLTPSEVDEAIALSTALMRSEAIDPLYREVNRWGRGSVGPAGLKRHGIGYAWEIAAQYPRALFPKAVVAVGAARSDDGKIMIYVAYEIGNYKREESLIAQAGEDADILERDLGGALSTATLEMARAGVFT